ncbi:hypothetical protein Prudu_018823, partial [Prunus dulcis]
WFDSALPWIAEALANDLLGVSRPRIYARHVLYMEIKGQGAIPLTRTDENLTPREIEQKATKLAYFLSVPVEIF